MSGNNEIDEVSAEVSIKENGFFAKIKSRFVSTADRTLANKIGKNNPEIERPGKLIEARTEADINMIEAQSRNEIAIMDAATKIIIEQMGANPQLAERVLKGNIARLVREQNNNERVLLEAANDLTSNPATEEQANSGPEKLYEEFLDAFDEYARKASTEVLQKMWGKVLAREIREPGTFNKKVLRIIDEIDTETAKLFEEICKSRIGDTIQKLVLPKSLNIREEGSLVDVGLIQVSDIMGNTISSRLGGIDFLIEGKRGHKQFSAFGFDQNIIAFDSMCVHDINEIIWGENLTFFSSENKISLPVYILTRAGHIISSIFSNNLESENLLIQKFICATQDKNIKYSIHDHESGKKIIYFAK